MRLVRSPPLSAALLVLWILLAQSVDPATLLGGVLLAITAPALTASLRPSRVRLRRPLVAARLLARVLADSVRSNVAVGAGILGPGERRSGFVHVPLDVRDPNALAVLAMIVTATPGTAWAQLAHDRSALLLHVFSIDDEEELVAFIKRRYERPLMEIFE